MELKSKRHLHLKGIIAWIVMVALIIVGILAVGIIRKTDEGSFIVTDTIENDISKSLVLDNPEAIPEFQGNDYFIINDNRPFFSETDLRNTKGEVYSELDFWGRCGMAVAIIDKSMMPTEKREGIGQIKPTGWVQAKYDGYVNSNPPYLYNRCHLIAYGLTGQNSNERNLITGTRYFNVELMLPYEEQIMKYLDSSDNHVLYRVTPYFKDNELVARGVEMEAFSIEDNGVGVCYHVFAYNYQPGIEIDYATGKSKISDE